jgi:hypothetical protein
LVNAVAKLKPATYQIQTLVNKNPLKNNGISDNSAKQEKVLFILHLMSKLYPMSHIQNPTEQWNKQP